MPITINDAGDFRVGRVASTMDAFTASVAGTYTAPGDRVGVIRANVAEYTTSLLGQASVPENRDGLLDSTLDNFTAILNGQLTAGATFDVWVRDDGSDNGTGAVGDPYATVAKAFTQILPGIPGSLNTIHIDAAGSSATFTEEVIFTKNYIKITNVAGKAITWAGISTGNRADPCFQYDNAIGCVVDGIDIDGGAPSTGSTVASCATFRDSVDCGFINASCDDVYGGTGVQNNDVGFLMGDFNTGSTRCYLRNLVLTNEGAHEALIGAGQDRGDGILIPNECVSTELDSLTMTRWGAHDCIVDWGDRTWAHDIEIDNDWTSLAGGTDRYGRAFSIQDQQEPGAPLSTGARGSLYEDIVGYNLGGETDASRTLSCKVGGDNVVARNLVLRNNPNDYAIGFAHEGNRGGHYENINIYNYVILNHGGGAFELFENTNGTGNGLPDYPIGPSNRFNGICQNLLTNPNWTPGVDERNATVSTTRYTGSSDGSILASPFVFQNNIVDSQSAYIDNEGENPTSARETLTAAEAALPSNFNNNLIQTVTFPNSSGTTLADFVVTEGGGRAHTTVHAGDPGTGTLMIVDDSTVFRDDMGITGRTGDQFYLGGTLLTIQSINHGVNEITVDLSVTRSPGDALVWAGTVVGLSTGFFVSGAGSDSNDGTESSPWATIAKVNAASIRPGTTVSFERGYTYTGVLQPPGSGTAANGNTINAYGTGADPILRECQLDGDYWTVTGIDFNHDGGSSRVVRVRGNNNTIDGNAIHNGTGDGVDIRGGATGTIVNDCDIYLLLAGVYGSKQDAHGIVLRAGNGNPVLVTITNNRIRQVSGDCFQTDPDRLQESDGNPGSYANYTITATLTGNTFYTEALTAVFNGGWGIGDIPGEDGIDTKANAVRNGVINMTVTDHISYGFEQVAEYSNRTPFNLKESVNATLDRLTLYNNELGFRLRRDAEGNPAVTIKNAVVYDCGRGMNVDGGGTGVDDLKVYNSTFGSGITDPIQVADGGIGAGSDFQNNAWFAGVPAEIPTPGTTNVTASSGDFSDESTNDYRLLASATTLVDQGADLFGIVDVDRNGTARTGDYEIGAYEGAISSATHAHFDYLSSNWSPEVTVGFHSQPEVDTYFFGDIANAGTPPPAYDASQDAEKWPFPGTRYSYFDGQSRIGLNTGNPCKSLLTWEIRYSPNYAPGVHPSLKTMQMRADNNTDVTISDRFDQNRVVWSMRTPWSTAVGSDNQDIPGAPTISYDGKWMRWWYWYDMANNEVAVWRLVEGDSSPTFLGRSTQLPSATAPNTTFGGERSLSTFLWEMNSSEGNDPGDSVDRPIWGRNFVHVDNIDFADVQTILAHSSASEIYAPYSYYDFLAGQTETQLAIPWRSQADVDNYMFGVPSAADEPFYDAAEDATQWPFPSSKGSYFLGQQHISDGPGFGSFNINSGKAQFCWEAMWSDPWGDYTTGSPGQQEHKAFQISANQSGDDRLFEIQVRYGGGTTPQIPLTEPDVGHVTLRTYLVSPGGQGIVDYPPLANFIIQPNRWTRFWVEIDYNTTQFSMWVGDSVQGVIQMYDGYQFTDFAPGSEIINDFWWEFNASIERSSGPDAPIWGRNWVVLHNADMDALVAANTW